MKKFFAGLALVALLAPAGSIFSNEGAVSGQPPHSFVPGEVIVTYRSAVSPQGREGLARRFGASRIRAIGARPIEKVKLPTGVSVEKGIGLLRGDPRVKSVQPNFIYSVGMQSGDINDPFFGRLWGLSNTGGNIGISGTAGADISALSAWSIGRGSPSVLLAVIDTGIDYTHPDLRANMWTNGVDRGWDFVGSDADPMDQNRHGTHVAGTIGATGNNGEGITGVNWTVGIMPVRALDASGNGTTDTVTDAIYYAMDKGATIINASWSGSGNDAALKAAIEAFQAAGGLFVAAAGNSGSNNDQTPAYPASYVLPGLIAVAATNEYDGLASFSNYGAGSVHVAAPGRYIYSSMPPVAGSTFSGWSTGGDWRVLAGRLTVASSTRRSSQAVSSSMSLTGRTGCRVSYDITYNLAGGDSVSVGETATNQPDIVLKTYSGSGTASDGATMTAYPANASHYVTFTLTSPVLFSGSSVSVAGYTVTCDPYGYLSGTSMATPHVAGIAALIKAVNPSLSNVQIKQVLTETVDTKTDLANRIVSGGRVNAYRALSCASLDIPSGVTATATGSSAVALAWTSAGGDATGFVIQRGASSVGPYADVGSTEADSRAYTDTTTSGSSTYYYRVRSRNSVSNSLPSDPVSVTTSAPSGDGGGGGGGCFIATAAYGSPLAAEVALLRAFRDRHLMTNGPGRGFVRLYYRLSPPAARFIAGRVWARTATRAVLSPLVLAIEWPVAMVLVVAVAGGAFAISLTYRRRRLRGPESHSR